MSLKALPLAIVLLVLFAASYAAAQQNLRPVDRRISSSAPFASHLTPEERANIRVYEVVNQSVVHITTSTVQYDRMFGMPIEGSGVGSGAIIDKRGHILTNHHVIEGADKILVKLADDDTNYVATLVGADEEYDIAVLRIDAPADRLQPIALGRSDTLRVGQKAYALGNPFGLEGTLTTGIVSSLNRSLPSRVDGRAMTGMIQTDAAMNPGNSGGPLLNTAGEMIGMCVAIRSTVGQNSGVGFAIPMNRIRRFTPELLEHGKVIRAYHGIVLLNETSQGLRIAKISPGGPADNAGLRGFRTVIRNRREGPFTYRETAIDRNYADYVLTIDGKSIRTHEEFLKIMDSHKPGDRVVFSVMREGKERRITLTLGAA